MKMFDNMLSALNTWYDSYKLCEQRKGVYVSMANNNNGKRFVKIWTCQFEKWQYNQAKIHNYLYFYPNWSF